MPTQLPSGRWLATRTTSGATEMRIYDTKHEAEEFENE